MEKGRDPPYRLLRGVRNQMRTGDETQNEGHEDKKRNRNEYYLCLTYC